MQGWPIEWPTGELLLYMKKNKNLQGKPVPVRLENEQNKLMDTYQAQTGLGKSFIIRRCIAFTLPKFINEEANILSLQNKK